MSCFYCDTFQRSKVIQETREDGKKITTAKRFCFNERKVVVGTDELCGHFEMTSFFWCDKIEQRINISTCQAKQKRGDCGRCRQKSEILEIRKFVGKNGNGSKKAVLIKRREPIVCHETEVLVKRKIIKKRTSMD